MVFAEDLAYPIKNFYEIKCKYGTEFRVKHFIRGQKSNSMCLKISFY